MRGKTRGFCVAVRPPSGASSSDLPSFEDAADIEHSTTQRSVGAPFAWSAEAEAPPSRPTSAVRGTGGSLSSELQLPDAYASHAAGKDVAIPTPRACAQQDYVFSPASRITGRVLPAEGRPAVRVQVEAADPEARAHPIYGLRILSATTNAEGDFEIGGVPPGRYVIGINLKDLPSNLNPYGRALYPSNDRDGEIVTIGAGQAFDLGRWRLPPPLAVVKVEGVATWQDGKPAAGVYVGAWDVTGNPIERARGAGGATVDADGRFVLDLRQGRAYTFMARDKSSALLSVAGPRLVVGTTAPDPVRLVIGPAIKR